MTYILAYIAVGSCVATVVHMAWDPTPDDVPFAFFLVFTTFLWPVAIYILVDEWRRGRR